MVNQTIMDESDWTVLVSNVASKPPPPADRAEQQEVSVQPSQPRKDEREVSERSDRRVRFSSEVDARDGVEEVSPFDETPSATCQPKACGATEAFVPTPFEEEVPAESFTVCGAIEMPFDESSPSSDSEDEFDEDVKKVQRVMSEIMKQSDQRLRETLQEENERDAKCSLGCNPEASANAEEGSKPVMERKDDTLDYIFNLVEIALCGEKGKTNLDETIAQARPKQMPDPILLMREKNIFETLNPGRKRRSKKKDSKTSKSTFPEKESQKEALIDVEKPTPEKAPLGSGEEEKTSTKVEQQEKQGEAPKTGDEGESFPSDEQSGVEVVWEADDGCSTVQEDQKSIPSYINLDFDNDSIAQKEKSVNTYTPNLRKLRKIAKGEKVKSAISAFNAKTQSSLSKIDELPTDEQFALTKNHNVRLEQQIFDVASALMSRQYNGISPEDLQTPKGAQLLASVVAYVFWPENVPRNKVEKPPVVVKRSQVVESPPEEEPQPSLLTVAGGNKERSRSLRRPSSMRRMSSRRNRSFSRTRGLGGASTKKSCDV